MVKPTVCPYPTANDKIWVYGQYYTGDLDEDQRRNGIGDNHWQGPESLEWYSGQFLRDTMHGLGEYRCRHREGVSVTYEGHFYANRLHGYGVMSYPNGAVFTGLFHNDIRWGPGVQSHACLREDVGLWRGTQLVRLVWRPSTPNVALDFYSSPQGKTCVEPHRIVLEARLKTISKVNSAIELLKQCGAEPRAASTQWTKLYPNTCTDLASQLCETKYFENDYYKKAVYVLEEVASNLKEGEDLSVDNKSNHVFYAWNNNEMIRHMMKHSFKHDSQGIGLINSDINSVLSEPRTKFKQAGQHEINCRTLLMASYLGDIKNVSELINKFNVHPDISDNQGNTALMYAACGDQVDIIHFLVEAGASINSSNDNCCTPLAVSLMRYACSKKDISASDMAQAMIPPLNVPASPVSQETKPSEWHISRDTTPSALKTIPQAQTKIMSKSLQSIKKTRISAEALKKKADLATQKTEEENSDEVISEDKRVYLSVNAEFSAKLTDLFSAPKMNVVPYLFEVDDMVRDIIFSKDEATPLDKNVKKVSSKVIKGIKPSRETVGQNADKDEFSPVQSVEKTKMEALSKMLLAILQLLNDGADPNLVRCPQPALFIATVSGCSELVRHLINFGADVNEVYPQAFNYTALDLAVSRQLSNDNLDLIRVLLECGAKTDHRLQFYEAAAGDGETAQISGPNLLHAALSKKIESNSQEEICHQLLELLLEYNCSPMTQFRGRSPIDIAMSMNMNIFKIFLKSPITDLNAAINDAAQTVLVKMFSIPFFKTVPAGNRLQMVTDLLLFGADPLLKCRNVEQTYKNIFVFANEINKEINPKRDVSPPRTLSKGDKPSKVDKSAKADKPTKSDKLAKGKTAKNDKPKKTKDEPRSGSKVPDIANSYKQALDLMTECARILYVRWLQAKLLKELLDVVVRFKHRQWNMILPEHKNQKACGLWLTASRALEIWNIFKTSGKKIYSDKRVLKHMLCIISFYVKRSKSGFRHKVTADEKNMIESELKYLHDHKMPGYSEDLGPRPYVMPELFLGHEKKFKVCFECALPFEDMQLQCDNCKLVNFCSYECMKININHIGSHPCSKFLRNKYFSTEEESDVSDF